MIKVILWWLTETNFEILRGKGGEHFASRHNLSSYNLRSSTEDAVANFFQNDRLTHCRTNSTEEKGNRPRFEFWDVHTALQAVSEDSQADFVEKVMSTKVKLAIKVGANKLSVGDNDNMYSKIHHGSSILR